MSRMVKGSNIVRESINADRMRAVQKVAELAFPIVTADQSVTDSSQTELNGRYTWKPGNWDFTLVDKIEVEVEYATAGAGEIDLAKTPPTTKLATLISASAATSHTVERVDVTSTIEGLSSDAQLEITAAGDGTNATTVYKATLIVTFKL